MVSINDTCMSWLGWFWNFLKSVWYLDGTYYITSSINFFESVSSFLLFYNVLNISMSLFAFVNLPLPYSSCKCELVSVWFPFITFFLGVSNKWFFLVESVEKDMTSQFDLGDLMIGWGNPFDFDVITCFCLLNCDILALSVFCLLFPLMLKIFRFV